MSLGSPLGARLSAILLAAPAPLVVGALAGLGGAPLVALGALTAALLALLVRRALGRALAHLRTRLVHQSLHDALTGLPNRVLFADRTGHALVRARSGRHGLGRVAVVCLDLDGFKEVNDELGHAAGDALLGAVSTRLRATARDEDTIARLGDDEFAVLLEDLEGPGEAEQAARRLLDALGAPVPFQDRRLAVEASVGIAVQTTPGDTAADLLRDADAALERAKAAGRGRHCLFAGAMRREDADRRALVEDLRAALDRNELHLVYQPIVDLVTDRTVAAEALLRWDHPVRGTISPGEFVPLAEETGLIVPIGRWVVEEACREAVRLQRLPGCPPDLTMAVNLSPRQLEDDGLHDDVARCLEQTGLDPAKLVLELTETELTADLEAAAPALARLKALGVRLALDDVGAGYSRLSYLRSFPVDMLKLDRELIAEEHEGTDSRLTRALVALGRELELTTVAEGIERPEQLAELRRRGCNLGQGFLLARPMAPQRLAERLMGPQTGLISA